MNISATTVSRKQTACVKAQTFMEQTEKKTKRSTPVRNQDEVVISPEAQKTMAKQDAQEDSVTSAGDVSEVLSYITFTSFAEEFNKITQGYADIIREHYATEHEENLTYDDPNAHIWDKYKNPDSPCFRSDLSEDERAWAYDQELDLLNGGRHLQMGNPYVFPNGAPTLASAAMQAIQACREQIGQSIQDIFDESGIEVPADASFRLTVDDSYTIHVTGLEDEELTEAIEQALNRGDNGKNLYDHLKLTTPNGEALGVEYADGHLAAVNPQQEMDDDALTEVKKQAGPAWARYSEIYDPHKTSMNDQIVGINPDPRIYTPERMERLNSAVRMGMPELLAGLRTQLNEMSLIINPNREVDPDGSIALQTYMRAYAQTAIDARKAITEYYTDAHAETMTYANAMAQKNNSDPLAEALNHIAQKYLWSPDLEFFTPAHPEYFRWDMGEEERQIAYRQERALLMGTRLSLYDPYALASVGGLQTMEECHQYAMKAVQEKLEELRKNLG